MPKKEIPIKQLRPGMFVSGLDISWIKSPFLTHSMRISGELDIERLKSVGVKEVTIDTDKGVDIADEPAGNEKTNTDIESAQKESAASRPAKKAVTPLKEELVVAKQLQNKSYKVAKETSNQVQQNRPINASPIRPIIDNMLQSLVRNDQAILSLLHLENSNEKLLAHLFNVFSLTLALAVKMDLSDEEREALGLASFIHDAAWTKLPFNLFCTKRKHNSTEQRLVQKHIDIICSLLARSEGFTPLSINIVREHHELCDGSGYPLNLTDDQISLPGKVLAVADWYDELIHGLAGHPGMLPNNALSFLYGESQKNRLDANIVAQLITIIGVYPLYSAVLLTSGEKAIVIENNRDNPVRPIVKVFYKATGMRLEKPKTLNLSDPKAISAGLSIEGILDPQAPGVDPFRILSSDQS